MYTVRQYWNGIHWDDSYTDNRVEAEEWKKYIEDKSNSVYDRLNWDAITGFKIAYGIEDEEDIEVIVVIVEE